MLTLNDAVDDLYRIAVVEGKKTSTKRLTILADLCAQELAERHIRGVQKEIVVPGIGRDKQCDVAWVHTNKVRLVVSLKSLLSNFAGTVPNRADDLMGEMANVQLVSPEIVTGYIMVFDTQGWLRRDGGRWVDTFKAAIEHLSGRKAPAWAPGMVEAAAVVEVDFSAGPMLVSPQNLDGFFDRLSECVKERNRGAFD